MLRILAIILLSSLAQAVSFGKTIIVPTDYAFIQTAINASVGGDVILVKPGVYMENIDFNYRAITVKSMEGPKVTIIDGGAPKNPNYASVVCFDSNENHLSVLEGFTIRNGTGSRVKAYVYSGGGIFCKKASPTIRNNIIVGNHARDDGGGVYCMDASPTIVNNIIMNNQADGSGGGLYISDSDVTLINNTIVDNGASIRGGGLYAYFSCYVTIINSIFWGNQSPKGSSMAMGIDHLYYHPSTLDVSYCDVQGGLGSVYPTPYNSVIWSPTNTSNDPMFVDYASGDLHLKYDSPCRNSGNNAVVTQALDFENDPRIAEGAVDRGADEFYSHLYYTGQAAPGHSIEVKLLGTPGGQPVYLWLGSGILTNPIPIYGYGFWRLQFPLLAEWSLGVMPSPNGVLTLSHSFPISTTPFDIPLQAYDGVNLTNSCLIRVK